MLISSERPPSPLTLWYCQPATVFEEALPIGNGRLGAMMYGGVERERLSLNEGTLWASGPYDPVNPKALAALPQVRKLVFAGEFEKARTLIDSDVMGQPLRQMMYLPAGNLILNLPREGEATDYRRDLDLADAVARVRYTRDGVRHTREAFATAVDGVIVLRLCADRPGRVNFTAALRSQMPATAVHADGDTIVLSARNSEARGIAGALRFEMRLCVRPQGGQMSAGADGTLTITGADSADILISIATSYLRFDNVTGDPQATTKAAITAVAGKPFDALHGDHLADYRSLFDRVTLDLGTSAAAALPTDERVRNAVTAADPALEALYFQYGRYLLISSSRGGGQPANLQGIWNELLTPPWDSKWTVNINTEMNYWPSETTNLAETNEPLLRMIEDLSIAGARTARTMYGARGWVVHHNTDLWRATAPIDGAYWGMWPTGGAWLCQHLWEHYAFDPDPKFLERVYPLMKGASEFFLDTLVEDPATRYLVTNPSLSPENGHRRKVSVAAGPAMDNQILRDLFARTAKTADLLGRDTAFVTELLAARDRLPPDKIGAEGQLQEWQEDWDAQAPDKLHRHISHLYGLFPSDQIDPRLTPQLADAARTTLNHRGDITTGWAIAWRLNCWARLLDGNRCHRILKLLLDPSRTFPNLFDAHPPFQIDGNFGGTSGMAEMLLQSHNGEIHLLPALPAAWPRGTVTGLRARGGVTVDLEWADGTLTKAAFQSQHAAKVTVRYEGRAKPFDLTPGVASRYSN